MAKLFLVRHFKSQWNFENRFTGWVDVPLLEEENKKEARKISEEVFKQKISKVYSSPLFRNEESVFRILKSAGKYPIFIHLDKGKMANWGKFSGTENYIPAYISEKLNERCYGKLQGLNKKEIMEKYGEEKVHLWRRGYKNKPPGGESLKNVYENRTTPFFKKYILKDLKNEDNILVVSSHNSSRALAKYIEKIPDEEIINFEIPYGGMIEYEFNKKLEVENKKILT